MTERDQQRKYVPEVKKNYCPRR